MANYTLNKQNEARTKWALLNRLSTIIVVGALGYFIYSVLAPSFGPPPPPPVMKAFNEVCANEGVRVAVTGYPRLPDSFKVSRRGSRNVDILLYQTNAFTGAPIVVESSYGFDVEEVGDKYAHSDLRVRLRDGTKVGYGTKVKVSGKVYNIGFARAGEAKCRLEGTRFEPAD